MDSDLYSLQQHNFLTMVSYYNKSREIAENFYSYIEKYKEYTKQYFNKINQIFSYYSSSLYDDDVDFFDEENDNNIDNDENEYDDDEDFANNKNIFDLNLDEPNKNKINNINNISSFIKNEIKASKYSELDLPPIYRITTIFFKHFKNQINGLKLFLKGIDISIKDFKNVIDKIKKDADILKKNYLESKQNFFQNILCYQKTNKELLMDYSKIESKIAKFSLLKKNEYICKKQKNPLNLNLNKIENDINLKIIEIKTKEKDFLKKEENTKNYCVAYKNESEKCIKGLKNNVLLIIKNLKCRIEKIMSYYTNCYHLNYSELPPDIKKIGEMKNENEIEDIMKQNLKEINDDIVLTTNEKYKPIHYDIQILKNKEINQQFYEKLIKKGYDIQKEDLILHEDDINFIVKKMYNFDLINKEDYNTDKENNKLLIINLVDKMFDLKDKQNRIINNPKISDEKLSKLYKLLETDKDYRLKFLEKLGNKRAEAILELHNNLYNIITKIFLLISDIILKEKDTETAKNILILSQTFYRNENGEKIYLFNNICQHQIYQKEEFWIEYLNDIILFEIKKRELNEKRIGRNLNDNEIIKRNNEIIFAQLLTMSECMKNFGVNEEKIIKIISPIFVNYKTTEENKEAILNYIKKK